MNSYKMIYNGMYGEVEVPLNIFKKLNLDYFISPSSEYIKYMCANEKESIHLKSLGIKVISCDWYCIKLKPL